jgi:hypothetical protein
MAWISYSKFESSWYKCTPRFTSHSRRRPCEVSTIIGLPLVFVPPNETEFCFPKKNMEFFENLKIGHCEGTQIKPKRKKNIMLKLKTLESRDR